MTIFPPNTPTAMPGQGKGILSGNAINSTHIAQVAMFYQGRFTPPGMAAVEITCEVYEADGVLSLHTACPKCRHTSWVRGDRKAIEFDRKKNLLSVEAFKCSWEMEDKEQKSNIIGLNNLCGFTCAVEKNTIREV